MKRLPLDGDIICVRGAGDLATGVIQKLVRVGLRVFALEIEKPTAIRRQIACSTALTNSDKTMEVEDIKARCVEMNQGAIEACWEEGIVPIIVDPEGRSISLMHPICVVDAILAKRNLGTHRGLAPITIGMGPGFSAPEDVDCVIETMRGHRLGRLITQGEPLQNTGTPGDVGGQSKKRVIHAVDAGTVIHKCEIGDFLQMGDPILEVGGQIMTAPFAGVIRGLITAGMEVPKGMKIADIDPRNLDEESVFSISDKARNLGGAVLEAYLYMKRMKRL